MPTDDNSRVTNARLDEQIKGLRKDVNELTQAVNRRMAFLEEKHEVDVSDLRGRCQDHAEQLARLDERQKAATGILGVLSFVSSSIAATIGSLVQ